ncbi:DUF3334 family protein [Desulfoluna sp.]|uniref:DUF3334 family protein n=1 Tax=Desulfoluna sp. TaxID=2045199 RepID=UPI002606B946|nr:DUF3334 family protein [Desulfoluna sp.]
MKLQEAPTIDLIAAVLSEAVTYVLELSIRKSISFAPTLQTIPKLIMRPDISCFVQLSGDFSGLIVFNFSDRTAVKLYQSYMVSMGIPPENLVKDFTSNEVTDSIGEIFNQVVGEFTRLIETEFGLSIMWGQPKVLALTSAITLTIDADYHENRRIAFAIDNDRFQAEVALEQTQFTHMPEFNRPA